MAADDLRIEYHLTPGGWVKGTQRYFGRVNGIEVARPADAIVTFEDREFDSSNFGQTHFSVEETWRDTDADEELIGTLLELHGSPVEGNWAGTLPWKNLLLSYKAPIR